jgi:hypothetical protein
MDMIPDLATDFQSKGRSARLPEVLAISSTEAKAKLMECDFEKPLDRKMKKTKKREQKCVEKSNMNDEVDLLLGLEAKPKNKNKGKSPKTDKKDDIVKVADVANAPPSNQCLADNEIL